MQKTLYVSDLDGTLLQPDAQLSVYTVQTMNRLMEQGLWFTVASARSILSARGILDALNLSLPGIYMNGVLLCNPKTEAVLDYAALSPDTARQLVDAFESCGRPPFLFSFEGARVPGGYSGKISVQVRKLLNAQDQAFYQERRKKYSSFEVGGTYRYQRPIYVNGAGEQSVMQKIYEKASAIPNVHCELYLDVYTGQWILECHYAAGSKAARALELKRRLCADRLVAFGDQLNDIEMLQAADVAVAVGNACPQVQACADVVIGSNVQDGVAKYLEQQIL